MQLKTTILAAALSMAPGLLHAQFDFKLAGRDVQIHSFASQGFTYSDNNNYLTMKSSEGSFAFTDGGVNISTRLTDKFRVGAQVYARNIGELGNGRASLDWGFGDYRFKDWFGIRGGKVKTALGLLNDTQDTESLHTWAILPQSLYPLDLRSNTIAHTGGDIYGEIAVGKLGSLGYTAYFGARTNDPRGGNYYSTADAGSPIRSFRGKTAGADLRWTTPLPGLMVGGSWADQRQDLRATINRYGNAPLTVSSVPQHITSVYGDYVRGAWHFTGEYRKNRNIIKAVVLGSTSFSNQSDKGCFLTAAYRVTKRLEIGTYHSRYNVDQPRSTTDAGNHIFDQTVTARVDLTRWWNVKAEGHFIDGYADTYSAHGFYTRSNAAGLQPTTNMLVIRTGFSL